MKLLALLLVFVTAKPGYRYEFPRDHFAHHEFKTEWWYFTGNLRDPSGRRFGFELTFFRQATGEDPRQPRSPWDANELWLAHLTLSDIESQRFLHEERINRAGPGLAGADPVTSRVWNGNWSAVFAKTPEKIEASTGDFMLNLNFETTKPPVVHGIDGVSQKAEGAGRASHYVSFTRLQARGSLQYQGRQFDLSGSAWMDHEFFTHQLEPGQTGWDWVSIQLDDNTELMLFRLRRKDGSLDPYSAGTYVDSGGRVRHLSAADFRMAPLGPMYHRYPIAWRIEVPSLGLDLRATTPLPSQELAGKSRFSPAYWEGAMDFVGTRGGKPVRGAGYLEMTGYAGPVRM
ncbi:MAG: lipocalin-like domain-containing protein [Bryobacteraceae bacterium]